MLLEHAFQDKVAAVTGATSGIGRAIAIALAKLGAEVCLVARRATCCKKWPRGAERRRTRPEYATDWTRDEDIAALAGGLERDFGRADIAGALRRDDGRTAGWSRPRWKTSTYITAPIFAVPIACFRMLLPLLRRGQGQIVFINSSAALRASAGAGQYAAMQHALRAAADSLRDEVNGDGIRVLSVYAGRTATPRM